MGQTGEGILLPRPSGRTRGRVRSGGKIGRMGGTGTVSLLRGPATEQWVCTVIMMYCNNDDDCICG